MRYWDSSAVVPLVVAEDASAWARRILRSDPEGIVWVLSPVEVRSALSRRLRDGALSRPVFQAACRRAGRLFAVFSHVVALEPVGERALRLLDLHPLRAADALQLAAALVVSRESPGTLPFVTLDERLAEAAEKEGFAVDTLS
jgi:hypothetical protein